MMFFGQNAFAVYFATFGACRLFRREPHRSLSTLFACLSTTDVHETKLLLTFLDAACYFWRSLWRRNVFGMEMV